MASPQMQNLLNRYGVTTEPQLLEAIAAEYTEMCCDPGDPPFEAKYMGATLDEMLEAEYQRIAGGAYDDLIDEQLAAEVELISYRQETDPDALYERWLETRYSYDD